MGAATCPRCGAPPWSKTAAFQAPDDVCCWAAGQRSENAYDSCARRMSAQLAAAERERQGIARLVDEYDAAEARGNGTDQLIALLDAARRQGK